MNSTNALLKRIALGLLGLSLMAYGLWPRNEESTATRTRTRNAASVGSGAKAITPPLVKIPIKDMRVGTRVPAFNPEVSAAERRQFTEPNWYRWMKLKLEMPKPDGTTLEIEMLRSEDWIIQQLALIVEPETSNLVDRSVEAAANGASAITINENSGIASTDSTVASDSPIGSAWVPLRPIYFHLADLLTDAASDGDRVLGMIVELDLPELGLTGPAWVIDLEPAPIIPAGPGQVVTATFKHASASVLDLVLTSSPPATLPVSTSKPSATPSTLSAMPADLDPITESIGVTANHPFWSVDLAEFVQAGELTIGERLQTLAGDTVWVQQKLPRPGPEPVYNLEVHAEHVYYVGTNGVLAHNAGKSYVSGVYDQLDTLPGFQNHHLLQQKAFPNILNVNSGPVIRVQGKIGQLGSQHNVIHRSLEGFFDVHRVGRTRPTVGEYLSAMNRAARNAGFSAKDAHQMTSSARRFLSRLQLEVDDLIPNVPGRIPAHFLPGGPL